MVVIMLSHIAYMGASLYVYIGTYIRSDIAAGRCGFSYLIYRIRW